MNGRNSSPSDANSRVVSIRRGRAGAATPAKSAASAAPTRARAEPTLAKYEGGHEEASDYRHRMIVNVAAFVFVMALIGAGLWLADTMASMRKNQDCVLSGRRGCTPVEVKQERW